MVGQTQKIINADMIKLSQCSKNLRRYHAFSTLIVSIGSLRYIDLLAKLSLCKIRIFS